MDEILLESLWFDDSSTGSLSAIVIYVVRMKDAPWTMQGKGGRSWVRVWRDSGSLKADYMASNREQVLLNRLGYLLFPLPWDLRMLHLG